MTERQFTLILDEHDFHYKIRNIYKEIISSNVLESLDDEIMDAFLSHFEFNEDISFEEFVGFYKMFRAIYRKDKFPVLY